MGNADRTSPLGIPTFPGIPCRPSTSDPHDSPTENNGTRLAPAIPGGGTCSAHDPRDPLRSGDTPRTSGGGSDDTRASPREEADAASLIRQLFVEQQDEASARIDALVLRARVRASMCRQREILDQLASARVPFTLVAHRLRALAGHASSPLDRCRDARRLRKRRERARETCGRAKLSTPSLPDAPGSLPSKDTLAAASSGEESEMPKLVKRTVVEHYEVDDLDDEELDDIDAEECDEECEETRPSKRSKR